MYNPTNSFSNKKKATAFIQQLNKKQPIVESENKLQSIPTESTKQIQKRPTCNIKTVAECDMICL
jgi:hypothetical protein